VKYTINLAVLERFYRGIEVLAIGGLIRYIRVTLRKVPQYGTFLFGTRG